MSAGWAGLTITYAMSVTETFNYVLINFSQVQLHSVGVTKSQNILLLILTVFPPSVGGERSVDRADPGDGEVRAQGEGLEEPGRGSRR